MPGDEIRDRPPPSVDPTFLTTQNLLREIAGLKELLTNELVNLKETTKQQFTAVEQQRVEQKKDTKDAVDAALSAQRDAVRSQQMASDNAIHKTEQATKEQLAQQATTFTAGITSVTNALNDLKERVGKIEAHNAGAVEQRGEGRAQIGSTTQVLGALIAVILVSLALYAALHKSTPPAQPTPAGQPVIVIPTPVTTTTRKP